MTDEPPATPDQRTAGARDEHQEGPDSTPAQRDAGCSASFFHRYGNLVLLSAGVGLFEVVRWVCLLTGNIRLVPALLILGTTIGPVTFALFLAQRYSPLQVTPSKLWAVAAVGGVIGTATAALIEYDTRRHLGVLPALAVAVIEEGAKLVLPAVVLLTNCTLRMVDALLVGVAAGAGFTVLETLGYGAAALVQSHDALRVVDNVLLQRAVFSPATHMAWTGITAVAFWYLQHTRHNRRAVAFSIAAIIAAIALHTLWDSTESWWWITVLAALGLTPFWMIRPSPANTPPKKRSQFLPRTSSSTRQRP